ncbi:MAG TPA: hypothetical protein VGM77_06350 [Gemmatimonadales bacterium]
MRTRWHTLWLAAFSAVMLHPAPALAQRTLDLGGPPGDSLRRCYSDSQLTAALNAINGLAAVRDFGGRDIVPAGGTVSSSYYVYDGSLRVDGTVTGDVLVLNGSLRVTAHGAVLGQITVIGGTVLVDPGANVPRSPFACADPAPLTQQDGVVTIRPAVRELASYTSGIAFVTNGIRFTPHVALGQYNRVEALPVHLGINAVAGLTSADTVHFAGYGVLRTGRDPSGSRPAIGWHTALQVSHAGSIPFIVGVEGGSTIDPTADRPFTSTESGLSAFALRRDYSDWFLRRGASVFASVRPTSELTLDASLDRSRQTTVLATDAFSILRVTEPWRPNPLIDDGTYQTLSLGATFDGRDARRHPVIGWYAHGDVHFVRSGSLTPVSLPTSIRDAVPTSNYAESDGNFDLRGFLRLDPVQRINARIEGGGYLGGDPLTIQRRRALGGSDPLPGYDFRELNCDRRRVADPATPALCDRYMAIQLEYRHVIPFEVSTRIAGRTIGIRRPDFVVMADAGTAWLAGDSAGRVPANRIQTLAEWKSDVGVGVSSGPVGFYIAKSLVDPLPVRFILLLSPRF